MPNYVALALEVAAATFGIRSMYEQPEYAVLERLPDKVEIRSDARRLAVEVEVEARSEGAAAPRSRRGLDSYNSKC
jgi:hypothetical protein